MPAQPLRKESDRNPQNVEEAKALVKHVESLFMPWNIDALVAGFTDDCVVRFGTVPEFRGRQALHAFFTARSSKQKGYRLKKSFRTLTNDAITNIWEGEWQDAESGTPMRGFGVELWVMRDGKIAIWEQRSMPGAPIRLTVLPICCVEVIPARYASRRAFRWPNFP